MTTTKTNVMRVFLAAVAFTSGVALAQMAPAGAPVPGLSATELDLFMKGKADYEKDFTREGGPGAHLQ